MLPDTNPRDYMTDDDAIIFGTMEVDTLRFEHEKPLVRPGTSLTTMMPRFHDWYMDICRKSGKNTLSLRVKEEHDLVGIDLLSIPYEEVLQFFNQKALDKTIITLATVCRYYFSVIN